MSVYIIRCRVEAASSVRATVREEILFRGDFPPWDGRADAQWFDISSDHAPLARQVFYAAKPWIVARYDGQRWLVPTANGWRERAEKITRFT